jgi:hypothetical protein
MDPKSVSIKRLQSMQNLAMRVITDNHKMASQDHLLAETEFLPAVAELDLICSQFLASASRSEHPSHDVLICRLVLAQDGRK